MQQVERGEGSFITVQYRDLSLGDTALRWIALHYALCRAYSATKATRQKAVATAGRI